ncbi:uncharacterized protein LOC116296353 [Actinia tenebrosa]|uniref:Uncharacterized protein LOC116296353 n=1 Tax=Actinia tenebrosa TaxID=6105 RepID=A0A6P8I5H2_ACTTE|nr:uncharacterized protein LOC116296353 [Actinia tenebrosa]
MENQSSESDLASYDSDDSEFNYIPGIYVPRVNYEEENENYERDSNAVEDDDNLPFVGPYENEPLADEEWLKEYKRKKEIEDALRQKLQERIDGVDPCSNWCSCGNCNIDMLQNVYEAKCCRELDGCVEACHADSVLEETQTPPNCIILHPGFRPICLEKWALKQSASKYKTRDKRRYNQIGKESTFLRAVAYREFCQLVYRFLGAQRIPLPACAYHAIRSTFSDQDESFIGFEFEED